MDLRKCHLIIFHIADRHVVLLHLNKQQVVDGHSEVITANIGVVDGDTEVFLFLRRIIQQRLHLVSQETVVLDADRYCGDDDTDNQRPIQHKPEGLQGDGVMEYTRERDDIGGGDKEYQSKYG